MERMNCKEKIGSLNEFLSVVFEYGANNSYIDDKTGMFRYQNQSGEFTGMDKASTPAASADVVTHYGYFRKYTGQPIGVDPVYNYKNTAHPSY